ncbi:hypothetical protein KKQ77_18110 [Leptospira interrogans]|uniref:hypothetical protein n=1 Tax=Leptospira interrogans TaxID=173 RepID=UPI001C484BE9|nr:hypothetical protein [Leptospira interrogans]MBV6347242.1 hypothetical protein [Leptospira interrogans]MBV6350634.1 hypothetical protein [Leptospira interrogans]MBV6354328.1 hypothetical protein [Leptospira interrogans]MBV6358097.1 hypothetical protein [Leptospira interrogans]
MCAFEPSDSKILLTCGVGDGFARIELVPTILEFVCKIVICGSSHILEIDL